MLKSIKHKISPYYTNLRGWTTNRKIVVIESDDWGSIRMPSKEVYEKCLREGYRVDQNPYERYDSLEQNEDLELLFQILSSFKDKKDRSPVFTANILVTNPNFEMIKNSNYEKYHFELVSDTFKNYSNSSRCLKLWKEGIEKGLFFPQSHGREHLNVSMYMEALRQNDEMLFSFNNEILGSLPKGVKNGRNNYVLASKYSDKEDKEVKLNIILDGLSIFKDLLGYNSSTFIPPNYIWSPDFDKSISKKGVSVYQGKRVMLEPNLQGGFKKNNYVLGQKNDFKQTYLIRNAFFEPSLFRMNVEDPVERCLRDIGISFKMKKPAIISSHRVNYVGRIDKLRRDKNLSLLNQLLNSITIKWNDVEFMTSSELGELIALN